ncbi:hypothetical protein ABZP36_032875, partial [Zizania latifolia]
MHWMILMMLSIIHLMEKLGDSSLESTESKESIALERHNQKKVSGTGDKKHGSKKKSKRKKSEANRKYISKCHIVVSSCIFGNSDRLRTPFSKMNTSLSKKTVCFAMFLDEITLQTLQSEGQKMDDMGFIGIWKIILIENMPYNHMRRVGKIPKFLAHRFFPSSSHLLSSPPPLSNHLLLLASAALPPREQLSPARRRGSDGSPRVLENACRDDDELRVILGDSIGNPELMKQR